MWDALGVQNLLNKRSIGVKSIGLYLDEMFNQGNILDLEFWAKIDLPLYQIFKSKSLMEMEI